MLIAWPQEVPVALLARLLLTAVHLGMIRPAQHHGFHEVSIKSESLLGEGDAHQVLLGAQST